MTREAERQSIQKQLRNARARLSRAQRDVEALEAEERHLDELDALDAIRAWRGVPDWPALLRAEGSMCLYMLGHYFVERMGLSFGHRWADTAENVVTVSVARKDDPQEAADYVARIRAAIEALMPHMTPHADDGLLWFSVGGDGIENFALNLRVAPDLSVVKIVTLTYGTVDDEMACASLADALFHLQAEHPADDAFEYMRDPRTSPGGTGEALRAALTAFVDGCRSAGVPIDDTGAPRRHHQLCRLTIPKKRRSPGASHALYHHAFSASPA